jgi:hypothetical protein
LSCLLQTRKRKRKGDTLPGKVLSMPANGSSSSNSLTTQNSLGSHQQQQMNFTENLSLHQHSPISSSYGTVMMIGGNGGKLYHHHQGGSIEGSPIHNSHELIKTEHLSNLNGK